MKQIDLLTAAARVVNYIASGEQLPNADANDASSMLSLMLEAWSAERLQVFTLTRSVFNLQAGKQAYTYGTGGDFNASRPADIYRASIISNANPAQPLELPIDMYTDADWQEVRVKNTPSPLPRGVYDDGGFPLRTLSFWPQPSDSSVQTALYVWTALTQFPDLAATDITFPPGYLEAIKYNLAVRMAAEWPGTVLTDAAAALARTSLSRIRSLNAPMLKLKCDSINEASGHYNWLTDTPQ